RPPGPRLRRRPPAHRHALLHQLRGTRLPAGTLSAPPNGMDARDVVPVGWQRSVEPGGPEPLGSTLARRGTNFAIHAPAATRVTLVLFSSGGLPRGEHALDRSLNRTGSVWHVFVPRVRAGAEYAWRAD